MSEPVWYRSLYWRIALGFIVFLTVMLVVQGALLLWLLGRSAGGLPARSAERLATLVAADLSVALAGDEPIDPAAYLQEQYADVYEPVVVVMTDGRVLHSGPPPAEPLVRFAQARLRESLDPGRPAIRRPGRFATVAPIVVKDRTMGLVVVPAVRPRFILLRQFGPLVTLVAAGLVLVGTGLAALLIFRPARRRLRALEEAAGRLGGGDLSARAPERGGDEVAALAGAFNRMARDLGTRAEELEAADRLRRQLLADVSHELTTPLTAIRGYVETLTMAGMPLDEGTRARYLRIIAEETSRLERIIGDLLDLARFEGGGGSLQIEEVSVAKLFERVTARHERTSHEKGVTLSSSIGSGAEVVRVDPDRLEQALQNLAANALRHTAAGGTVELRAEARDEAIVLAVRDTGEGIPPEHLPFIFDRFYKVDASRPGNAQGSGLGLSIVKAIVERHGGQVSAHSRSGETVLEIRLPRPAAPSPRSTSST